MIMSILLTAAISVLPTDPATIKANQFLRTLNVSPTTLLSNDCGVEKNGFTLFKAIDHSTGKVVAKFYCNTVSCHQ